jgi:C4-dicarboxylate transporter DctM subunit
VVAVVYILLISLLYRDLRRDQLARVFVDASVLTSRVMLILAAALVFGWFLVINQVPQQVAHLLLALTSNPFVLLLLINLVLVVVHTFLETGSTILIVVPILLPVLQAVGVDPVHFGVVVLLNSAVGILLPPIGIGLYTATSLTGVSLESAARSVLPFVGALLLDLLLVIGIPAIALALPNLVLH